jgi:hypothetical protein
MARFEVLEAVVVRDPPPLHGTVVAGEVLRQGEAVLAGPVREVHEAAAGVVGLAARVRDAVAAVRGRRGRAVGARGRVGRVGHGSQVALEA